MTELEASTIYKLRNTSVRPYPYPHFYIQNVFPKSLYQSILDSLPPSESYSAKGTAYHGRQFADPTQNPLLTFMQSNEFIHHITALFYPHIVKHFEYQPSPKITHDLRLVRDHKDYQIGPHTDAQWKLVSLLFYLPTDNRIQDLGTSIFIPNNPNFSCNAGIHHPFEPFTKVFTAPFLPNSCFGFFRTSQSFHGVSPITIPCERNVLLFNLNDASLYPPSRTK